MVDRLYSLTEIIGGEKEAFLDDASDSIIMVFATEFTRRGISLIDCLTRNSPPSPRDINLLEFLLQCYEALPDPIRQKATIMDFIFHVFFMQHKYCLSIPPEFIEHLAHKAERLHQENRRH
jgi:hypothetical protein